MRRTPWPFIILCAVLILALLAVRAQAGRDYFLKRTPRTYYVDMTAGNDNNTGTAENLAWKTVAKVNGIAFNPGDRILFKGGQTFTDARLSVPSSGVPGVPITFATYGTGNATIYGDSAIAIRIQNKHDLVFRNLSTSRADANYGVQIEGTEQGPVYNVLWENCDFGAAATACVILYDGNNGNLSNITFIHCTAHDSSEQGFHIYDPSGLCARNISWIDCTSHSNGTLADFHHGWYVSYSDNVRLIRCTAYGNAGHGFQMGGTTNTYLRECHSYSNGAEGILMTATTGGAVENCIVQSNGTNGIDVNGTCANVYFYHNTVVNNANCAGCAGFVVYSGAAGNVIKNNLVVQDEAVIGASHHAFRVEASALLSTNTWDYNAAWYETYGPPYAVAGYDKTIAEWRAYAGNPDAHGLNVDPVFVTEYTDLHLAFTSPVSTTAVSGLGVFQDYDGDLRSESTPAMGCYEY